MQIRDLMFSRPHPHQQGQKEIRSVQRDKGQKATFCCTEKNGKNINKQTPHFYLVICEIVPVIHPKFQPNIEMGCGTR